MVEVIVAVGLLAAVLIGVAAAFGQSVRATARSRRDTIALLLAVQKLEQLRGLDWEFVGTAGPAPGTRVSDTTTDLAGERPMPGGPGLAASPPGALSDNTHFYVDFADAQGGWAGTGTSSTGAVFVRRWAVTAVAGAPEMLRLEVVVSPVEVRGAPGSVDHADRGIRLITARTRLVR